MWGWYLRYGWYLEAKYGRRFAKKYKRLDSRVKGFANKTDPFSKFHETAANKQESRVLFARFWAQ